MEICFAYTLLLVIDVKNLKKKKFKKDVESESRSGNFSQQFEVESEIKK